jgi:hypothetical protein
MSYNLYIGDHKVSTVETESEVFEMAKEITTEYGEKLVRVVIS